MILLLTTAFNSTDAVAQEERRVKITTAFGEI